MGLDREFEKVKNLSAPKVPGISKFLNESPKAFPSLDNNLGLVEFRISLSLNLRYLNFEVGIPLGVEFLEQKFLQINEFLEGPLHIVARSVGFLIGSPVDDGKLVKWYFAVVDFLECNLMAHGGDNAHRENSGRGSILAKDACKAEVGLAVGIAADGMEFFVTEKRTS